MAFVLAYELNELCKKAGLERVLFATLTVPDKTPPPVKELQRRFRSLRTNVLTERYGHQVWVVERGDRTGRLHLHGVVTVDADVRTGLDFEAVIKGDYATANRALRAEWRFWREMAPNYGFGRSEWLPVRSNAEGIARYVGSYIKKHIMHRESGDKGARLIRFVGYGPGDRQASTRMAWATDRSRVWRRKVETWARAFGMHSLAEIQERVGPRWAWQFQMEILGQKLDAEEFRACSAGIADDVAHGHLELIGRKWEARDRYEAERGERPVREYQLTKDKTYVERATTKAECGLLE